MTKCVTFGPCPLLTLSSYNYFLGTPGGPGRSVPPGTGADSLGALPWGGLHSSREGAGDDEQ